MNMTRTELLLPIITEFLDIPNSRYLKKPSHLACGSAFYSSPLQLFIGSI